MKTPNIQRTLARPLTLAAVFIVTLAAAGTLRASERWATLEAIHQLENPRDLPNPGSFGELGPYQFREMTWKMHTAAPFSRALDKRSSDAVAVKHYDWIKGQLERRGVAATPYTIALAWNGGIRAAVGSDPPKVAVNYALRASNLAESFEQSERANQAPPLDPEQD